MVRHLKFKSTKRDLLRTCHCNKFTRYKKFGLHFLIKAVKNHYESINASIVFLLIHFINIRLKNARHGYQVQDASHSHDDNIALRKCINKSGQKRGCQCPIFLLFHFCYYEISDLDWDHIFQAWNNWNFNWFAVGIQNDSSSAVVFLRDKNVIKTEECEIGRASCRERV